MKIPLTGRTMKILLDLSVSKNWNFSWFVWLFRRFLLIDFLLYWIEIKKNAFRPWERKPWKFLLTGRTMKFPLTERTMKILLDLSGSKNWDSSWFVWLFRRFLSNDFLLYWIEIKKNAFRPWGREPWKFSLTGRTMKIPLTGRTMKFPLTERTMKILLDLSGSKNWNFFWLVFEYVLRSDK